MPDQPAACPEPKRVCPMSTPEFHRRLDAIERDIIAAREGRHEHNAQVNRVVDEVRIDIHDTTKRLAMLENLQQRVTQLLEGYASKDGLVTDVKNQGERITKLERNLYIAIGGLAALQILFGMGIIPPFAT